MPALALTDHGTVHGLVGFYRESREAGVKPILGCEVYLAPRSRYDRQGSIDREPYHLVLLAENEIGYHNLIQLSSRGHTEGFYYKPRVDWELLERYHQGLIVLSACLSGEIPQVLLTSGFAAAEQAAKRYLDVFGAQNFYLEMQDHGLLEERRVNQELPRLAQRYDVGLVATNDVHYLRQGDAEIHDILLCVQTQSRLNDRKRLRFPNDQYYFKSETEMQRLFTHAPQALSNTLAIAERCMFDFRFGYFQLPEFPLPPGEEGEAMLRRLVCEGLERCYGKPSFEAVQRAEHELGVIVRMGFVGYFLIVWDFVRYAKSRQIDVGPGRGSVTGSLVAYALNITEVDPLAYDLLFERFLNPERISMPDIDIDFCFERRSEVIEYVTHKYGSDHVAQIVTFGTLGTRGAVRDIARVLEIPPGETDRIAKLIPWEYEQNARRAVAGSTELQQEIKAKPIVRRVFELAELVEGKPRNISMHAAGVVITPKPLTELLPLLRPKEEGLLTHYAMDDLEALGFLKMDFLGLRTLTLLRNTQRLIQRREGRLIELKQIPLDDAQTYALLSRAETDGVFQLESPGMKKVLRALKPNCIEDIIAANALHRPGPMEHIPEFIAAKNGVAKATYLHPRMEPILAPTYGVLVYQEQVMRIANELAGFSLGQADLLRRAMSKRDPELLQAQRQMFLDGALAQGVEPEVAEAVFDLIRPFSSYGFNKSHSAAYGILAYQTAWFKTHYPVEYGAALLSSLYGSQEQIGRYVRLMRGNGIHFLPPRINASNRQFSVEGEAIRFGLLAIKNIGVASVDALMEERRKNGIFSSLQDFCLRLGTHLNKRSHEALIRAGALDDLGDRARHLMLLPEILERVSAQIHLEAKGQTSLLGNEEMRRFIPETLVQTDGIGAFTVLELQQMEEEATGFVFSQANDTRVELSNTVQQSRNVVNPRTSAVEGTSSSQRNVAEARPKYTGQETVVIRIDKKQKIGLEELKELLRRYPGSTPVYLQLADLRRTQRVPQEYWVRLDSDLLRELETALGGDAVRVQSTS